MKVNVRCPVTGKKSCKNDIACAECLKFQKNLLDIFLYVKKLRRGYGY